ncbi:MAG: hypothetical protein LAT67_11740 [Balneolales bacterium]|nr:hypothetical protein [Balneolales bacterium]
MHTMRERISKYTFFSKVIVLGLAFLLSAGLFAKTNAQQSTPPILSPLEHELKVYPDPESGEFFWPLSKPVYVRLAVSPEDGAESHLLQKMFISRRNELIPSPESHIDLDVSGNQFIRWFNVASRDTVLLRFQADGLAPESQLLLDGAERYENQGIVYYGKGLKASVQSTDRHSGVEARYLSVNRADYEAFSSAQALDEEMFAELWYYAVDRVGNTETPRFKEFQIDLTPPETEHFITGTHVDDVLAASAEFSFESRDALSGVRTIWYRLDSGSDFTAYTGSAVHLNNLEDGPYTLEYYSVDNVGNAETHNSFDFYVDRKAPVAEVSLEGDHHLRDGINYVSARTQFSLSAEDNKSGLRHISYDIDGQQQGNYLDPFRLPGINGERVLQFRAEDRVGNISEATEARYFMDVSAPVTSYRFEGARYNQRNQYWITSSTRIILDSEDAHSGVQFINYDLEGNVPETRYTSPLRIPDEGRYNLSFFATDRVNNEEGLHFVLLIVDDTPPEIITNFNTASYDTQIGETGEELEVYRIGTRLFMAATDNAAGADRIEYRINDEPVREYQQPVAFNEPGEYLIRIEAVDNVGNRETARLHIIVAD